MNSILRVSILAMTACLVACSSSGPRIASTPVRQGMSSEQLISAFGRPLRVERNASGGEKWFYQFGSQKHESHPISESSVTETERSFSTGQATSTTTTMTQAPLQISPSGHVVGEIPSGSIVLE